MSENPITPFSGMNSVPFCDLTRCQFLTESKQFSKNSLQQQFCLKPRVFLIVLRYFFQIITEYSSSELKVKSNVNLAW